MATIKQVFGSNTSLTVAGLATLASGGTAVSNEVNNSVDLNLAVDIEVNCACIDGTLDMYMMRSNETGDYQSTDELSNMLFIGSVTNGGTTPSKTYRVEQLPKFYQLVFINSSGSNALTAGTINLTSANLTN